MKGRKEVPIRGRQWLKSGPRSGFAEENTREDRKMNRKNKQ